MKNINTSYTNKNRMNTISRSNSNLSSSTNYKATKNENILNSIANSLRFFVDNSESIKFMEEPKDKFKKYRFNCDSLYKAIYHEDKFSSHQEKKKFKKSSNKYFDDHEFNDKNKFTQKDSKKYF